MPSGKKAPWHWKSWKRDTKRKTSCYSFLREYEKVPHCIAFVCKSDIIPIRKQGGENHGKNGEYQCPY